ncbi:hypothetical protein, partial [Barnesiella intestinihominis]|uniref:hypothetical protein n=1 Tax=Barnesiella intestinihominis TaxID=487174 RepID=UPI003AB24FCF
SVFFQLIQRQHDMYKEIEGTFLSRFMREYLSSSQHKTVSGIVYFKIAKHELRTVFDVLEEKDSVDTDLRNLIKNRYNITIENINEYNNKGNKEKMGYAYKCFFDKHYELSNCHRHLLNPEKRNEPSCKNEVVQNLQKRSVQKSTSAQYKKTPKKTYFFGAFLLLCLLAISPKITNFKQ